MKAFINLICIAIALIAVSGCKPKETKPPQQTIKSNAAEIINEAQKLKDSTQQVKPIDENEK